MESTRKTPAEFPTRRDLLAGMVIITRPVCSMAKTIVGSGSNNHSIYSKAEQFVAQESPENCLPFRKPAQQDLNNSKRKVWIDYFSPLPLSFANEGFESGKYESGLLSPRGQEGRFAQVGGYVRERPLPVPSWDTPDWRDNNLAIDVLRAHKIGADGFIVDLLRLPDDENWNVTEALYRVTSELNLPFRLVPEPDGAALRNADPISVAAAVTKLAAYKATFHLPDGRLLVSPFAPENFSFEWWTKFLGELRRRKAPATLLPTMLSPIRSFNTFKNSSVGLSWWGTRDYGSVDDDVTSFLSRVSGCCEQNYTQPVAPQDVRPKVRHFSEAGNTRLLREMWTEAIRHDAGNVHLITWNDFSEGSEIEPSSGIQFLMYDLCAYFIFYFKIGKPPSIISDAIFYCHRRQMIASSPEPNEVLFPTGRTAVSNDIELLAFLTAPAILEITIAGRSYSKNFEAGLQALEMPASIGKPTFRILREKRIVVQLESRWEIRPYQHNMDPLYVGGSSSRSEH